jgi:hypothetical protein
VDALVSMLAALLCRHLLQRYAATSGEALHSYPATRFARIPPASGGRPLELAQKQDIAGSSAASSRRPLAARFAQMEISHKSKNGPGGITSPYGVIRTNPMLSGPRQVDCKQVLRRPSKSARPFGRFASPYQSAVPGSVHPGLHFAGRMVLLTFFLASVSYLYKTGSFTPRVARSIIVSCPEASRCAACLATPSSFLDSSPR